MEEIQHLTDKWGFYISCLPTFIYQIPACDLICLKTLKIITVSVIWDSYRPISNVLIGGPTGTHLKSFQLIRSQIGKCLSMSEYQNSKQTYSPALGVQMRLLILDYLEWKTSNCLLIFSKSNVSNPTVTLTFLRCKCNKVKAL